MKEKYKGKIKEIIFTGYCTYFKIEYINGEEKLTVESIPYSAKFNRYTHKVYDKVEFELVKNKNKDNRAKIIDENLFEKVNSTNIFGIIMFLTIIFCWFAWKLSNNVMFFIIPLILFIVYMGILIIERCMLYKKGIIVKGKIVSKKVSEYPCVRHEYWHERFDFEVLYNDKIYCLYDFPIEFAEKINIGDEIDIAIYKKNTAVLASEFIKANTKGVKVNYKAMPLLLLMISIFVYLFVFGNRMIDEPILFIPFVVIIIMLFIYIPIADGTIKRKKKKNKS